MPKSGHLRVFLDSSLYDCAEGILDFLSTFQMKEGGLLDPDLGKTIPNSYGNAFYALACAKRYVVCGDALWKDRAVQALRVELNWAESYERFAGVYRFEFKNYALLQIYSLLRDELDVGIRSKLELYLHGRQNICSYQTNYAMMRALNSRVAHRLFGSKSKDLMRARFEMSLVGFRQDKDGLFSDDAHHHSFQYHAYVLALLYQYYLIAPSEDIRDRFLRGVDYLLPFIDLDGDFNYIGRGQRQVFGYASYIYALRGAAALTGNSFYVDVSLRVEKFVMPTLLKHEIVCFVGAAGVGKNVDLKVGYYPYNNRSDYLSFAAYYLMLAASIDLSAVRKSAVVFDFSKSYSRYYATGNLLLIRDKDFLCVLGGTPGNHAELPFVLHTSPFTFSTSGGPSFGLDKRVSYARVYTGFSGATGAIHARGRGDVVEFIHNGVYNIVSYRVMLSSRVEVMCCVTPKRSNSVVLFHAACKSQDAFECSIPLFDRGDSIGLDGLVNIVESEKKFLDKPTTFRFLFGSVGKGVTLPVVRASGVHLKLRFDALLKYPYFASVLFGKTLRSWRRGRVMMRYHRERKKYY